MKKQILFVLTAAVLMGSCGKNVEQLFDKLKKYGDDLPANLTCETGRLMHWHWQQPEVTTNKVVDLLFVVDTSLSLLPERGRLSKTIPHFLRGLPADADARIAVLPAHGGGLWNGRLYSSFAQPAVIDPHFLGLEAAENILHGNLCSAPLELGVGNGEMLLGSLSRSLETDRFTEAKKLGFFRDGAALSVVFVSDENDPCFKPQDHGYSTFPDFNENGTWLENIAYDAHCVDARGALRITPESVAAQLQDRFPARKISLAGIVHTDPTHVDRLLEDSIGHGIIETVQQYPDGVLMDIRTGDFEEGLRKLASVSSTYVALMTSFELITNDPVHANSLLVLVDGRAVSGQYDEATRTVKIRGADAGGALSRVDIAACVGN